MICGFVATIERFYSHIRIISLDVTAAALGGGILATRVIGSTPRIGFYWLLPAGVWVVYTMDHLLDARRMGTNARTPRHRFHFHHAGVLWVAVAVISLICAIGGLISLSWFGLIYAAVMCGLVILHETIVKLAGDRASPLLVKELGVAVVFTIGVWGMPWMRHRLDTGRWLGWPIILMGQYLLLAMVNLIEFSIFESKIDTAHGQSSFVRGIGRQRARRMVAALLCTQIILGVIASLLYPTSRVLIVQAIYLCMSSGLWIVLMMPNLVARNERYRTVGDGVFLLPLLMVIV
jgi:hypothetical protein